MTLSGENLYIFSTLSNLKVNYLFSKLIIKSGTLDVKRLRCLFYWVFSVSEKTRENVRKREFKNGY